MLPVPGPYRLNGPPPAHMIVEVKAGPPPTLTTTFGTYTYDAVSDLFVLSPTRSIKCLGNGMYRALEGPDEYTGTCNFPV